MCRGICRTSEQVADFIKPVRTELAQLEFSSCPFWTHKFKPKLKYKHISNMFHLLSTPASVPRAEPVLASLVVDSL